MKSFWRFIIRNRVYSLIEYAGLALSLGFVIILFSYYRQENSTTADQPHAREVYAAGVDDFMGMTLGTPDYVRPLVPEITEACRYTEGFYADIKADGEKCFVTIGGTDPNFFDFFHFRLKADNRNVWSGLGSVVLSESLARRIFPDSDPLGKHILLSGKYDLVVTGVMEDFRNTIFRPVDMIMNIGNPFFKEWLQPMDNFGAVVPFYKFAKGTDIKAVAKKMEAAYKKYWSDWGSWIKGSTLTRMDDIYFSNLGGMFRHGNRKMVDILLIIGLVLLFSALLNYINLTVAQISKRAKEMATRRMMGATGGGIILRYVSESVIFTAASFAGGYGIALLLRNMANEVLDTQMTLVPDVASVAVFILAILLIGAVAGIIPAMLISRYQPIDVVKGNFRYESKMRLSRGFIFVQNLISVVLISVSITTFVQMNHLIHLPVQYRTDDVMVVNTWRFSNLTDVVAEKLRKLPFVEEIGMTAGLPITTSGQFLKDPQGESVVCRVVFADSTAFRIFGFRPLETYVAPVPGKVWYTQSAAARLGIDADHLGQEGFEACGIIRNFHYGSALDDWNGEVNAVKIIPPGLNWKNAIVIKTRGDHAAALKEVKKVVTKFLQNYMGMSELYEIEAYYIDDWMSEQLNDTKHTIMLLTAFMIMAILISSLGLFAMSVYYCEQQAKAIAVRKVYGADIKTVVTMLSRRFIIITLIADIAAIPISVYAIERYLEEFSARISFPWWAVVVAAALSLVISFGSIFVKTLQTARQNPIKSIKTE